MPARLRPSAPIAPDAVLVGDPGRALLLAQELLEQPKMANHARGLWGYSGQTPAGRTLTVQSTGIGAPSAAAVLADLAELGVERAVRVGTCTALDPDLGAGDLLAVKEAFAADGVSRALGREGTIVSPDPELLDRLLAATEAGAKLVSIASFDLLSVADAGAHVAADQQTSGIFSLAPTLGIAAAALLVVAEDAAGQRIDDESLERAAKRAGRAAASALSA